MHGITFLYFHFVKLISATNDGEITRKQQFSKNKWPLVFQIIFELLCLYVPASMKYAQMCFPEGSI